MKKNLLVMWLLAVSCALSAQVMDLSGKWSCTLLSDKDGKPLDESLVCAKTVYLPGTTDTNQLGYAPVNTEETTHLTRLYAYKGRAKYERDVDIPQLSSTVKKEKKCHYQLLLERTKPSEVYLDGRYIGSSNDISTPQRYALPQLKAGRHHLTIIVDNGSGVPTQIYASSHAYTEDTQTNWNGIIGKIAIQVQGDCTQDDATVAMHVAATSAAADHSPQRAVSDCFRDFHTDGHHFYANGRMVFLRGKHDACVWPLTGHVPMDRQSWTSYMDQLRIYGINHIRFHSWCPPEAAFAVADSLGMYLQPELPFWGDFNAKDTVLMTFLHKEGVNILREYAHHPSFVMLALGNELWGSIEKMKEFTDDFRRIAPRIFYTFGSNYYLGYQGIKPGMDYFTTCRIGGEAWGAYNTHTRGSFSYADAYEGGMINHFYPGTMRNFDEACDKATVPVISHETGQFQTYPDYAEISKYTGVLYPYNMEVFRGRLEKAGMADQAVDFHRASGRWSALLYKADIEMDLRTRNMAGFQLLDIQDYPGQGSAYVGILDAFMDSKGMVIPQEWRQWCNDVVPMWQTDRFCYADGETLRGKLLIANYGGTSLQGKTLKWKLQAVDKQSETDAMSKEGTINIPAGEGLLDIGDMIGGILHVQRSTVCTLSLQISDTEYANSYQLWVYPRSTSQQSAKLHKSKTTPDIIITHEITDDIARLLENGAKVLWMPLAKDSAATAKSEASTVKSEIAQQAMIPSGLVTTDYWNYRMFKTICDNNKKAVSPGTLGILTDPKHPIFVDFPTEYHTNWQWYPILKIAHPLIIDELPATYRPIVQVIDNIERNHKLGLVMEFAVGKGKVLLCMSNLEEASVHPEGKAFYRSILDYMRGSQFQPQSSITLEQLEGLLTVTPQQLKINRLNNISQY